MRKFLKIFLIVLLAAAVIGTFYYLWAKSRPEVIEYELVSPEIGTIETKTVATGKIEPRDEVLIKPQISGIISEVLKEAGQSVKAGDIIAKVKVIPEMGQLSAAESRLRLAEIQVQQSSQEYGRQKQLYNSGVISKEEYEKAETAYRQAKEEVDTSKESLSIVRDGISKKSAQYSNTQIRSTIDGMILDVPIKVGNSVIQSNTFNDGTTIATIANMGDMIFRGKVDETEVGRITEGMPITLTVGALENRKIDAVLEYVSPKGAEENGAILFEVKAAAKIPENVFIRAGYSANAEIVLQQAKDVLTIPESCVEFSNDSAFVHILKEEKPEQIFEKKHIEIGISDGIKIAVLQGLTNQDKIRGNRTDPKANK